MMMKIFHREALEAQFWQDTSRRSLSVPGSLGQICADQPKFSSFKLKQLHVLQERGPEATQSGSKYQVGVEFSNKCRALILRCL